MDCSSELHVTMSEGETITSVSASEFSVAVTLSSGKVKLYTWTDIWDGSGTVSHSTITGNIAQVTSCSIYLLVWAIINIFNKKHSGNSDTSTCLTLECDLDLTSRLRKLILLGVAYSVVLYLGTKYDVHGCVRRSKPI